MFSTPIPQIDTAGMTDPEKAKIPPLERLNSTPTAAEARFFEIMAQGPLAMDESEYAEALQALREERAREQK